MKYLKVPENALILLIGASSAGKSTFAQSHFDKPEVISSDACRAWVSNHENDQSATADAFELLHSIVEKRLKRGLLTVVDATNLQEKARNSLRTLAKNYYCAVVAIVLDMPEALCYARNVQRSDRRLPDAVLQQQLQMLRSNLPKIQQGGFKEVYVLQSEEEVNSLKGIVRERSKVNQKNEYSALDIVGDVHGCFEELEMLLLQLGYRIEQAEENAPHFGFRVLPPAGRKLVFVGDLVDRGSASHKVLRLAMSMVAAGTAYCVMGNHDHKLLQYLEGKHNSLKHGLEATVRQISGESEAFRAALPDFLKKLSSHYIFHGGRLVVAHAGIKEEMQGRNTGAVKSFCMYGATTGETDAFGLPVRQNWARDYQGKAKVVYGHTPVQEAEWLNNAIDIDTGCVFGGKLTALRYPENEIVQVLALDCHYAPTKPLVDIHTWY